MDQCGLAVDGTIPSGTLASAKTRRAYDDLISDWHAVVERWVIELATLWREAHFLSFRKRRFISILLSFSGQTGM